MMLKSVAGTVSVLALLVCVASQSPGHAEGEPPWSERVIGGYRPFDPSVADTADALEAFIDRGEKLFVGKFVKGDGAGRPFATQAIVPTKLRRPAAQSNQRLSGPDANSCSGCHNDPVKGAAAPFTNNAFVSEGFESADFDTVDPQFSNERGSVALQGAGFIELLAREMTKELQEQRRTALRKAAETGQPARQPLSSKGVFFGEITAQADGTVDIDRIEGVDPDLVLRPFSQKGVIVSLRQFTVNALNAHVGIQADERFGSKWTGTADFDGDEAADEIGAGDVSAMVAWMATREVPTRKTDLPEEWAKAAAEGEALFSATGCAACHVPALPLESTVFEDPGPYDTAGTLRVEDVERPIRIDLAKFDWAEKLSRDSEGNLLVPLFGDLKRHQISDTRVDRLGNELLAQRFVDRDVFLTSELWGVGSTAPYGHRGDLKDLEEIIMAHGGEATDSRKAYAALSAEERQQIIAFLRSLEIAE